MVRTAIITGLAIILSGSGAGAQVTPPAPALGPQSFFPTDGAYDCEAPIDLNHPAPNWMPATVPGTLHISITTQTINGQKWQQDPIHTERVTFVNRLNGSVMSIDLQNLMVYARNPDNSGNDAPIGPCHAQPPEPPERGASTAPAPAPSTTNPPPAGSVPVPTDDLPDSLQ